MKQSTTIVNKLDPKLKEEQDELVTLPKEDFINVLKALDGMKKKLQKYISKS